MDDVAIARAERREASRFGDQAAAHENRVGRPVEALRGWLSFSTIESGSVFRRIDKWGNIGAAALDPQSVNAMIKSRCVAAGLDPGEFSAHGLRSGYLTEAARADVPLPEAMQQSRHRSVQQAARYTMKAKSRGAGRRDWRKGWSLDRERR